MIASSCRSISISISGLDYDCNVLKIRQGSLMSLKISVSEVRSPVFKYQTYLACNYEILHLWMQHLWMQHHCTHELEASAGGGLGPSGNIGWSVLPPGHIIIILRRIASRNDDGGCYDYLQWQTFTIKRDDVWNEWDLNACKSQPTKWKLIEAYSQTLCRNVGRNADEMRW